MRWNVGRVRISKIVELETTQFAKRLVERKISLEFTQEAKDLLIEKGYDEKYDGIVKQTEARHRFLQWARM